VILVRLHTDNHRWIQEVQEVLAQSRQAVQESQLMPEIQVQFAGSVQESLEDRESFFGDIKLSIILVSIFLSLLLWAYFKSFKICFYLLLSSVGSIFLTLASGYLFFHQATLQTGMIISVVAGNGVNFGILIAGRLKKGESWKRALPGMAASLLTICLGYVSCALTDFKGLQQFGILGMMGMVFSFISAIIVFGAAYSADAESKDQPSETVNPEIALTNRQDGFKWESFFTPVKIKKINRLGIGFLLILFLLGGYQIQRHGWVESDLSKLRDEKSLTHGALAVSKNVITPFFGQSLVPLQILVSDVRKMVPAMNGLYELIREHPEYGRQIRQIYTIYSVLPTDQEKKYGLLSQIKKYELTVQPSWIRNFDLKTLQIPVRFENVPVSVKKLFVEKDGMSDRTILLDLTEDGDRWNTDLIIRFAHDLRTKLDKIDSDVLIQARYLYTADLIRAVKEQGTLTTVFTFILVLLSVFIFTGKGFKVIIPSLVLGCLFLMVSFFALGLTLNPINFLTLPITIGIAADYSINLYFGLKGRDRTQSYSVIQDVICCSLTTIIGYGSMLFSSNLGLRSFSIAAVLGEITCCLIAVWWVGVWAPSKAN
jgi:predicted RND superfamily exporter protein